MTDWTVRDGDEDDKPERPDPGDESYSDPRIGEGSGEEEAGGEL